MFARLMPPWWCLFSFRNYRLSAYILDGDICDPILIPLTSLDSWMTTLSRDQSLSLQVHIEETVAYLGISDMQSAAAHWSLNCRHNINSLWFVCKNWAEVITIVAFCSLTSKQILIYKLLIEFWLYVYYCQYTAGQVDVRGLDQAGLNP